MDSAQQSRKVILAAGGIVERTTDGRTEIAVIHRTRYGGEWNLPKGKLDEGESPATAAIREIREETGCTAIITGFAGVSHYYHGAHPKFVVYWKMKPEGECAFEPSEEVDKLEWLEPEAARDRLSHKDEKDLVANVYSGT